jgi:hypothetical protein
MKNGPGEAGRTRTGVSQHARPEEPTSGRGWFRTRPFSLRPLRVCPRGEAAEVNRLGASNRSFVASPSGSGGAVHEGGGVAQHDRRAGSRNRPRPPGRQARQAGNGGSPARRDSRSRADGGSTSVQVRLAAGAEGCGALGCRRSEGLLLVESDAAQRVLCPPHAIRWVKRETDQDGARAIVEEVRGA